MSRAEKVTRAQELRAQGLLQREIAEQMGVSNQTVCDWLSDPDRSKAIARKERYRTPCVDCGALTTGDGERHLRCASCNGKHRGAINGPLQREKWREHRELIERRWADGLTTKAIRERTGIKTFTVGPYRARGYDLPFRYDVAHRRAA